MVEKLLHIATAFLFLLSYRPTRVCQWHFFRSLHVFIRRFASAGEKRKKPPVLFTAERHRGLLSHRDPAEGVGDGAQEDDGGEEGAEEADHGVEDLLAAERGLAKQDLLLDPADADDAGDQQADGDGRLADGTIACSAANHWQCLTNVLSWNIPEEEAVRAATYNPAKALGVQDQIGSIQEGKLADFIICSPDYSEKRVFIGGEEV